MTSGFQCFPDLLKKSKRGFATGFPAGKPVLCGVNMINEILEEQTGLQEASLNKEANGISDFGSLTLL